jgi:hypothetical protein
VGKPEGKGRLEDLDVCGKIVLKLIVEKYNWVVWTALTWLRIGKNSRLL